MEGLERENSNPRHSPKGLGAKRPGASAAHAERPQAREPKMAEGEGFEPPVDLRPR